MWSRIPLFTSLRGYQGGWLCLIIGVKLIGDAISGLTS